jgi:hypothetical protein
MPPKPTPTVTLAARGSWRAATRPNEPKPDPLTDLSAPPDLPEEALRVWDDIAPRLIGAGLCTVADVPALARLCRLTVAWQNAMTKVEAKADRSSVLMLAKLDDMVRKAMAAFGMTPADRTGISVEAPATNDKGRFFEKRAS